MTTPIRKKLYAKKLTAKNDGYENRQIEVTTKFNPVSCLNLMNPIAWGIDAATGKMMKYSNDVVDVTLTPLSFNYSTAETEETTHEVVSRDLPGTTEM